MKWLMLIAYCCALPVVAQFDPFDPFSQEPATASAAPTYYGVTNQPIFWVKGDAQGLSNNDPVTTAVDSSGRGSGAVFGQSTAGKKPTFKSTGLNGLPTLFFDGGDCLTNPSVGVGSYTLLVVTSNSAEGILMEQSVTASALNSGFFLYTTVGCSSFASKAPNASGKDDTVDYGLGKWLILRVDFNGTHAGHFLSTNGVATSAVTCTGFFADPGTSIVTDQINVGARNNAASVALTGHIAEFLLFSPALAGAEITTVATNIQTKYFP